MKLNHFLFMLFLFPTLLLSSELPLAEIKKEVELKINLTETGYKHLQRKFLLEHKGEEEKRSDFYFEIFDDNQYLLKRSNPPIKLRFMWDGLDLKWQVQKTNKTWAASQFTVKETESIALNLKSDPILLKMIETYHTQLDQLNPEALLTAKVIRDSLHDKKILSFSHKLCPLCLLTENYFSSHMNKKTRTKIKLKLDDEDELSVQVGETSNRGILSYELEAEIKKSDNYKRSAERLSRWLVSQGMTTLHIDQNPSPDLTLKSELDLTKLHSL